MEDRPWWSASLQWSKGVEATYRHDVVSDFDIGDTLTDALYDAASLVPEDAGKLALAVLTREGVGILEWVE